MAEPYVKSCIEALIPDRHSFVSLRTRAYAGFDKLHVDDVIFAQFLELSIKFRYIPAQSKVIP